MSSFVSKVRNGETAQPPQKKFNLSNWETFFTQDSIHSTEDTKLFEAGVWTFHRFEEIRQKLDFDFFKNISRDVFLKLLVSSANRVSHLLAYTSFNPEDVEYLFTEQLVQSNANSLNKLDPMSTFDMLLTSSIDSLRFPLLYAFLHKQRSNSKIEDTAVLNAVIHATVLGQFYATIDGYWMECLWNNWFIDSTDKADIITPPPTIAPIISAVSEYRRQVLSMEASQHFSKTWNDLGGITKLQNLRSLPEVIIEGTRKKTKYSIRPRNIDDSRTAIMIRNRVLSDQGYYSVFFDEELPNIPKTSVRDLINFWELLHALAVAHLEYLPAPDTSKTIETIDQFLQFSPVHYFDQLIMLANRWFNFSAAKIKYIIDFFTFTTESSSDLWSQVIIKLDDKRFLLLWSPVIYGNMYRTVELWMKKGGIDLSRSGGVFEHFVRKELSDDLSSSPRLKDAQIYPKNYKLKTSGGAFEEIDLIIRVGNVILVGEIKCVLFPSAPIERYRYFEILKKAALQIKRKVRFIRENESAFLSEMNFENQKKNMEYQYYPIILVNQPFGSGFETAEVPVLDALIIERFFEGKWHQFDTVTNSNPLGIAQINYFYESDQEAAKYIDSYLHDPPQLRHYKNGVKGEFKWIPKLYKDQKPIGIRTVHIELPVPKLNFNLQSDSWI